MMLDALQKTKVPRVAREVARLAGKPKLAKLFALGFSIHSDTLEVTHDLDLANYTKQLAQITGWHDFDLTSYPSLQRLFAVNVLYSNKFDEKVV